MITPTQARQPINTSVQYGSRASSNIMQVANAGQRLQQRLAEPQITNETVQLAEPQITNETVQAALKDVEEGRINSDNVAAVAQDIYKKTANSALIANVEVGGNNLGKTILNAQETANKYDTNSFAQSWGAYTKSTLSTITDLDIKQNVAAKLGIQGQKFGGQIATLQTKQQRGLQLDNFKAKMSMDVESLNAAFGVNNEEALRLQTEIDVNLQTMVDSNLIAPNMALMERRKIAKGAYLSNMQRGLTSSINSGDSYKFYDDFKKMDHQGILNDKDVEAFRQSIQSQIATDIKVYNQELQAGEVDFKLKEFKAVNNFNESLVQGELTTTEVDNALTTNNIDLATHATYTKKLQMKGKIADESDKKLMFQVHILDFTEDEIYNSPHLTDSSKWDLIKQRRAEIGDENNWLSSQSGKEAKDRIKRTFNIIDGTLMAQMDFNNKNMKEYDELYKNFFAEVETLPPEQRSSKSISIADKYIKQHKQLKEEIVTKRKADREAKKLEGEKKSETTYGETLGNFMNMMESKWTASTQLFEDFE